MNCINIKHLAKALKIDTSIDDEDKKKINYLMTKGLSKTTAVEEVYAEKILNKLTDLVEKVEKL